MAVLALGERTLSPRPSQDSGKDKGPLLLAPLTPGPRGIAVYSEVEQRSSCPLGTHLPTHVCSDDVQAQPEGGCPILPPFKNPSSWCAASPPSGTIVPSPVELALAPTFPSMPADGRCPHLSTVSSAALNKLRGALPKLGLGVGCTQILGKPCSDSRVGAVRRKVGVFLGRHTTILGSHSEVPRKNAERGGRVTSPCAPPAGSRASGQPLRRPNSKHPTGGGCCNRARLAG